MLFPIKGYEGRYVIRKQDLSIFALNFNKQKGNFRKMSKVLMKGLGYEIVRLSKGGKAKNVSVHRIVAEAFIPNPKKLPQVNHKNGVRSDNRIKNLEWCTCSYNVQDGYDRGRIAPMTGRRKHLDRVCPCGNKFYPKRKTSRFCSFSCYLKNRKNLTK